MTRVPRSTAVATIAPLVCAIHCALTPLLVVSLPTVVAGFWFEIGTFVLSATLATWSVVGGVRHHGAWQVALPVGGGLLAWGILLATPVEPPHAEALHAASAAVVAVGLLWNARRRHHAGTTGPCAACAGDHGG
jgi:hypothetical protein